MTTECSRDYLDLNPLKDVKWLRVLMVGRLARMPALCCSALLIVRWG